MSTKAKIIFLSLILFSQLNFAFADSDDDISGAIELELGVQHDAELLEGEIDWYKTTLNTGFYSFKTTGTTDTYLELYDQDGTTLLDDDDDSGQDNNALIIYEILSTDTYYIKLTGWDESESGLYSIIVEEITGPFTLSGTVYYSTTPQPNINIELRDQDYEPIVTTTSNEAGYYEFTNIPTGEYYVVFYGPTDEFYTRSSQYIDIFDNIIHDYYLEKRIEAIYPLDGFPIPETQPTIIWTNIPEATEYELDIWGADNVYSRSEMTTVNEYTFTDTLVIDEEYWWEVNAYDSTGNPVGVLFEGLISIGTLPELTENIPYSSEIEFENDIDWYSLSLGPGYYTFETTGTTDTYMELIDSDKTTILEYGYDEGTDENALINYEISETDTYFLRVEGDSWSTTGAYEVIYQEITGPFTLSGTVYYSTTPQPNINIELRDQDYEPIVTTTSNEAGYYEFTNIPIGKYQLGFEGPTDDFYSTSWRLVEVYSDVSQDHYLEKIINEIYPIDGFPIPETQPTIIWTNIPEATEYELIVKNEARTTLFSETITENQYTFSEPLTGENYWWHIYGYDLKGNSVGSGYWHLVTIGNLPELTEGISYPGELEFEMDTDWYGVTLDPGYYYFETTGSTDTRMKLYESDKTTVLDYGYDEGTDENALINIKITETGTYYIEIEGDSISAIGDYNIIYENMGIDPINTLWDKTFGDTQTDRGYDVKLTSDNGYLVTGFSEILDNNEVYLIKIDHQGNTIWEHTYGEPGNEGGFSVVENVDGDYLVTGYTNSQGAGGNDVFIMKTNSDGILLDGATFGGTETDVGYDIIETSEGGYLITGCTESMGAGGLDIYGIRLDYDGNVLWEITMGLTGDEIGFAALETEDGGFVVTGATDSVGAGGTDIALGKVDSEGNYMWSQSYGGSDEDYASSMVQTTDGGFALIGATSSFGAGDYDMYLVKTDLEGNFEWQKTYGWTGYQEGYDIDSTADGGFIIAGVSTTVVGADIFIVKTDSEGNIEWMKTHGDGEYCANSIIESSDGSIIIVGSTNSQGEGDSDIYIVSTPPQTFELVLNQGWNLISLPIIPDNPSVASVMAGITGYSVMEWTGTSYQSATMFQEGRAYWIKVEETTSIHLQGDLVYTINIDLEQGYNLVGGPLSSVEASSVLSGFYVVASWSPTGYVSSTSFEPGTGYLVFVLSENTINLP